MSHAHKYGHWRHLCGALLLHWESSPEVLCTCRRLDCIPLFCPYAYAASVNQALVDSDEVDISKLQVIVSWSGFALPDVNWLVLASWECFYISNVWWNYYWMKLIDGVMSYPNRWPCSAEAEQDVDKMFIVASRWERNIFVIYNLK